MEKEDTWCPWLDIFLLGSNTKNAASITSKAKALALALALALPLEGVEWEWTWPWGPVNQWGKQTNGPTSYTNSFCDQFRKRHPGCVPAGAEKGHRIPTYSWEFTTNYTCNLKSLSPILICLAKRRTRTHSPIELVLLLVGGRSDGMGMGLGIGNWDWDWNSPPPLELWKFLVVGFDYILRLVGRDIKGVI